MEKKLLEIILSECDKHISRYNNRCNKRTFMEKNFEKATGNKMKPKIRTRPFFLKLHRQFNPFYVRSNAPSIARAIAKKILNGTYTPLPCVTINKNKQRTRTITLFSIPDAAVAKLLNKILLARNNSLLSSSAFAYRSDRNAHDAIEHISRALQKPFRYYLLQYDFAKYFDSINHTYLMGILENNFKVNKRELQIIKAMISYRASSFQDYEKGEYMTNAFGIPQGSALSMFLANVACYEHDRAIERTGAVFARYSDDTVIICDSYEMANKCYNLAYQFGRNAGIEINELKSRGISLMTANKSGELAQSVDGFDFLGHHIGYETSLKKASIRRIKQRISKIINRFLIHYTRKYDLPQYRYTKPIDWDLVRCINAIRKYIYGNISESTLSDCLKNKGKPLVFTRSVMSYYPLVNDGSIFKQLDGWLVEALHGALRTRAKLLSEKRPDYSNPDKSSLLSGTWYESTIQNETQLPSFYRSWLYMRKLAGVYGLKKFPNPEYY